MANVSSSNGLEKYPKLRFKGFSEPWIKTPFVNLYRYVSEKNDGSMGVDKIISVANMYFKPDARISDEEYLRTYNVFRLGDIAFEGNKSKNFAFGRFVENTIGDGIVSHVFVVFRPIQSDHNLGYWKYAINNENVMGRILARCTKKTTMMTNLVADDFLEEEMFCPSNAEQLKISSFLELLERKIDAQTTLIEHLKKYKRGVSEQLFEQIKSKSTQHVFSSIFVLLQNNTFSRELLTNEETEMQNIHYGDVLIKYGSCVDIDKEDVPYIKSDAPVDKFAPESYLMSGDIVIADTAEDYTVGKATEIINPNNKKILSGLHTIPCRPVMSFAPMFMGYYLNSSSFRSQIMPLIQGTKVSSIGKTQLMKTTVYIPPIDEQKRIADFLYSIDTKINLLSETADKMIQLKSAMLQQLFI